jgi:hypothetical protein
LIDGADQREDLPKGNRMKVKAEVVIAELNRLRSDVDKDMTDPEYFALHHALCFISYKMGEFQKYLDEVVKDGEHP